MKVQFCSKKCQKSHWNAGHHKDCDKEWQNIRCSWSVNDSGNMKASKYREEDIIDIMIEDHCDKHDKSTDDCKDCMSKSYIPFIPIVDYESHIDKLRNAEDIVAPKRFTLRVDVLMTDGIFLEINRSKEISRKEMVKTVCQICKRYVEASLNDIEMMITNIRHQGNNLYFLSFVYGLPRLN